MGGLKSADELQRVLDDSGVDLSAERIVLSCGSGVTAAIAFAALVELDAHHRAALYDGSWAEYAKVEDNRSVQKTSTSI